MFRITYLHTQKSLQKSSKPLIKITEQIILIFSFINNIVHRILPTEDIFSIKNDEIINTIIKIYEFNFKVDLI